jgi:hypothetical protein
MHSISCGRLEISAGPSNPKHGFAVDQPAGSSALIQQGQPVPQGPVSKAGKQFRSVRRQLDGLLLRHIDKPGGNILGCNAL